MNLTGVTPIALLNLYLDHAKNRFGTCQAGSTSTTIKLDAGASASNNFYVQARVTITSGAGAGQRRTITAYNGTTKVATIGAAVWGTTPDATSHFAIEYPLRFASKDFYWKGTLTRSATAQAGTSSTITLDSGASGSDDTYNGQALTITSGTGAGQQALITDYVGSTKVATISPTWLVKPDNTSVFRIMASALAYSGRVKSWGTINQSLSLTPGPAEIDDVVITLFDVDGALRDAFDTATPYQRIGEVCLELESHGSDTLTDPPAAINFTGAVVNGGVEFEPGIVRIRLRSTIAAWLARPIPSLINRYSFPDLPEDVDAAFAPIVLGSVRDYSTTHSDPQGAINCPYVGKLDFSGTPYWCYCVARHTVDSVPAVYRKRKLDAQFSVISSGFSVGVKTHTINGISYDFTYIKFAAQPEDGTVINADIDGLDYAWAFSGDDPDEGSLDTGTLMRNPSNAAANLIRYLLLINEVTQYDFYGALFAETWDRCDARGYTCDIAFIEPISGREALYRICSDPGIDFFVRPDGRPAIKLFDETDDDSPAVVDDDVIMIDSFKPRLPEEVINRVRYRYYKQYAQRSDGAAASRRGFDLEFTQDNITDQDEMVMAVLNPLLETTQEMHSVRDDALAATLAAKRLEPHTLRSYILEYEATAPLYINTYQLAGAISVTSSEGMSDSGFVDLVMKIIGVSIDMDEWVMRIRAVRVVPLESGDLECSFTSLPSRSAQVRVPPIPLKVNGSAGASPTPYADLNSTTPAAPAGGRNITIQANTAEPRQISGYVPGLEDDLADIATELAAIEAVLYWEDYGDGSIINNNGSGGHVRVFGDLQVGDDLFVLDSAEIDGFLLVLGGFEARDNNEVTAGFLLTNTNAGSTSSTALVLKSANEYLNSIYSQDASGNNGWVIGGASASQPFSLYTGNSQIETLTTDGSGNVRLPNNLDVQGTSHFDLSAQFDLGITCRDVTVTANYGIGTADAYLLFDPDCVFYGVGDAQVAYFLGDLSGLTGDSSSGDTNMAIIICDGGGPHLSPVYWYENAGAKVLYCV